MDHPTRTDRWQPGDDALDTFRLSLSATYERDPSQPQEWGLFGVFATEAERDAVLARYPKSANVRKTTLSDDRGRRLPAITARGNLVANGVNGGINEAGLKRYRLVAQQPAEWRAAYLNSYATCDDFEEAIGA